MTATTRVEFGWRCSSPQAALAFYPPELLAGTFDGCHDHLVASGSLPSDFAARTYVIRSPWNVSLRPIRNDRGETVIANGNAPGNLSQEAFLGLGEAFAPNAWRVAENPVFQLSLNLFFISDVACSIQLMPPFLSEGFRRWPGTLICGRFPVTNWPRPLNAAMEWQDVTIDWKLKRGDPVAYVQVIYDDADMLPELVEAEMTEALRYHTRQIDGVAQYARNVGPMFERAAEVRPEKLLKAKILAKPV